jgi:subtilisin
MSIYGAWKKPAWFKGNQFKGFALSVDAPTLAALDANSRIATVEPDGQVTVCDQTNGLGILRMGITNFPVAQINGRDERIDVDVAVLDTGIQIDTTNLATNTVFATTIHGPHPDLPPIVHAVGFADPGYYGDDWYGHGTAMAGIIGALDNDIGVVGVAPGVRLWDVQVIGPTEAGSANVLAGLDYIAQHADQIEVVNASIISYSAPYSATEQAVASIVNQGTVFVAGAGNSGVDVCGGDLICGTSDDGLPAALPEVMAVSAMNPATDMIDSGSNFGYAPRATNYVTSPGWTIDVAAPGVNILSTAKGGGYSTSFGNGTSDSCAHVTGLVALYIAANGRATNAAGVYHIRQTLVDDGLPQTEWHPNGQPFNATNNPSNDIDGHPEPLAIANEAWVPQPEFYGESETTNGFALSFGTVPGYQYTVLYRDSLAATNVWNDLLTTNGTGKLTTVTVSDPAPGDQRFYRLERTPAP